MAQDARQYHLLNSNFMTHGGDGRQRKLTDTYRRLIKELSLFRRQNLADRPDANLPESSTEKS